MLCGLTIQRMSGHQVVDELGKELDRLYELPPGEFTAARDEAAKRLRAEGRRELADEVKRFRKPTLAVWLVNCLARERALDVKRLLKAGEALAASQAGGSADEFAEARREEQHALERLAAAAAELAEREGAGPPAVERAVQTMRAASLGAEGRELLERGRLTEELEPPGFAALAGVPPARAKPKQKPKPKDDRGERRRALEAARERVKELRADERERAKDAREAAKRPNGPRRKLPACGARRTKRPPRPRPRPRPARPPRPSSATSNSGRRGRRVRPSRDSVGDEHSS